MRPGEEREQELHEERGQRVQQQVLDLLQPHEVVGQRRTSTACAAACRRPPPRRRGRTRGTRGARAGAGRAGGGRGRPPRTGRQHQLRQLREELPAGQRSDAGPGQERALDGRGEVGAGRPASSRRAERPGPGGPSGSMAARGHDVEAVAVVRELRAAGAGAPTPPRRRPPAKSSYALSTLPMASPRRPTASASRRSTRELAAVPGVGCTRPLAAAPPHRDGRCPTRRRRTAGSAQAQVVAVPELPGPGEGLHVRGIQGQRGGGGHGGRQEHEGRTLGKEARPPRPASCTSRAGGRLSRNRRPYRRSTQPAVQHGQHAAVGRRRG